MSDGFLMRLERCELCPRRCAANRRTGPLGYCRAGRQVEIYRYAPHHGEEPPVSGTRGSGTIFFARCTMRCLYCQNYPWSQEGAGSAYGADELTEVFRSLRRAGCHNWNLVSPTPWLPQIQEALAQARSDGTRLPVVYNTSGYERIETLREYQWLADIFLTDLRYSREESAEEGSGARGYVEVSRRAFLEMWRQAGRLKLGEDGTAVSGVIVRLLILPGRAEEAVENLRWLAENAGTDVAVSVMAQYLPLYKAAEGGTAWARRIRAEEYAAVCETVEELGFAEGWMQEFEGATPVDLIGHRMAPAGRRG